MDCQPYTPRMLSGLYEQLLTQSLERTLAGLDPSLRAVIVQIEPGEAHAILAKHLQVSSASFLAALPSKDRLHAQIELCNKLLNILRDAASEVSDDILGPEPRRLLSLHSADVPAPERPDTPLSLSCLLTGTRLDPSLLSQLRKEIRSAHKIDILCSFIKWSGTRILEEALREFTSRPGAQLRVITTSYLGATDLKAIDFLSQLPNAQLRISFDTHRTRLHAKAYMFHRVTGFGSGYVGSSNLSNPALTDGLEWNIKVSQYEQPHLWEKLIATFDTYWNDAEFTDYSANQRERLKLALESERNGNRSDDSATLPFFDLRPFSFQQEILDSIHAERINTGRFRHLVVAATGTGKTMIAAFDYRHFCQQVKPRPRLLFVAHRKEILSQSLHTFRGVLRDQNFGDLMVDGASPQSIDYLFASIQSYNARSLMELPVDFYDYVVVDEFHHAAAATYRALLAHVRPRVLLGLTATPDRADQFDITSFFDNHISAEIRLPDAVNRKLLCPFQYFGVTDSVNLSGLTWERGGYRIPDLDSLYTGNDVRAGLVIDKLREKLLDIRKARGLVFCVSIAHANYMAEVFRRAGIPSEALSSESDAQTRRTVQQRLVRREINFICTVDLYNEGVDIPEIDTVLFLRPTESLTVFLQQLGRGLRLHEEKDCLTVLDFIGQAHRNYRFDLRFRELLSDPARSLVREIGDGFVHLPAGCSIQLERIAKDYVLNNISASLRSRASALVEALRTMAETIGRVPSFAEFLEHHHLDPDDVFRRKYSWSRLCVEAKLIPDFSDPDEDRLTTGLRRVAHIGGPAQIRGLLHVLTQSDNELSTLDAAMESVLLMAHLSLWGAYYSATGSADSVRRLRTNPILLADLVQLLKYRLRRTDVTAIPHQLPFPCALELHASYTRDEILAALGHWGWDGEKNREMREGVIHLPHINADAFMFTLNKTEADYSPTTMYQDYAVSDQLIHWQSQSTTSDTSATGLRYIRHRETSHTILLFARENKDLNGLASPYFFLGQAARVSHSGSKPISFTWRLQTPLPAKLLRRFARLAIS